MAPDIPKYAIEAILADCESDAQFEHFCLIHFSKIRGITYVPTSRSRDFGRDARTDYQELTRGQAYICASLEEGVETKAIKDLRRLLEGDPKPAEIRFCFRSPVSEPKRDEIIAQGKALCSRADFEVSGHVQIMHSIGNDQGPFQEAFSGEVDQWKKFKGLSEGYDESAAIRIGLGLSLNSAGSRLRNVLVGGLILECVEEIKKTTVDGIARKVSVKLGLHDPVSTEYLTTPIKQLVEDGFVGASGHIYSLTDKGKAQRHEIESKAYAQFLASQKRVISELEAAIGKHFIWRNFRAFWDLVTDGMCNLFYRHGLAVVSGLQALADNNIPPRATSDEDVVAQGMQNIVNKIEMAFPPDSPAHTAAGRLIELVQRKDSACQAWAMDLCVIYMMCCCLGLDHRIQDQILQRIRKWQLILDTNFALSILGKGEPDHEVVCNTLEAWKSLGGKILIAPPVAEEVRNHAGIAKQIASKWGDDLFAAAWSELQMDRDDQKESKNVFIRTHAFVMRGENCDAGWNDYISQFFDGRDTGAKRVLEYLIQEHKFSSIDEMQNFKSLAQKFTRYLINSDEKLHGRRHAEELKLRAGWDGRLMAVLLSTKKASKEKPALVSILSTSSSLSSLQQKFHADIGTQPAIVPLSRISFAMALLPDASLTLNSLRRLMFNPTVGFYVDKQRKLADGIATSLELRRIRGIGRPRLREMLDTKLLEGIDPEPAELPVRPARPMVGRGCISEKGK